MGIFDRFKKEKNDKPMNRTRFDRIDAYEDEAHLKHSFLKDKDREEMTEEEDREIMRRAGTHIGFFLTWIIKHHFEGEYLEDEREALEAVRREEMLGVDFFIEYCDGKFSQSDVSKEIYPFVDTYYKKYFTLYKEWVTNSLHKAPLEFVGTWEDYHKFEHILDEAYDSFCKK